MAGLFSWASRRLERMRNDRAVDQLQQFLASIQGFDIPDLGLLAAMTANVARQHFELGVDLRQPVIAAANAPTVEWELTEMVLRLQQRGKGVYAPGFMVWSHTFRALEILQMIYPVKQMWGLIAKGFAAADDAAVEFYINTGFELVVEQDFLCVPSGFDPNA